MKSLKEKLIYENSGKSNFIRKGGDNNPNRMWDAIDYSLCSLIDDIFWAYDSANWNKDYDKLRDKNGEPIIPEKYKELNKFLLDWINNKTKCTNNGQWTAARNGGQVTGDWDNTK